MVDPAPGLVLVVDDDASVRRALSRLLRSFGFEVQVFGSAVALLADGPPADTVCLVADVRMPDVDGVELCERLHAAGRDVPTVFVTAHGAGPVRSIALQGAPLLEKPVDAERLLEAISAARRAWARASAGRGGPGPRRPQ